MDPSKLGIDESNTQDGAPLRLVFLGGGSFGTAMSNMAARNGCDATLWVRDKATVKAMKKPALTKNTCLIISSMRILNSAMT